jgi:hypothetical protein
LWRVAHLRYGAPTDLYVRDAKGNIIGEISSEEGLDQGDPLALLLFALSLQSCFECALGPNVTPVAIVDDLEIVGEARSVFESYDRVVDAQKAEHIARESDKRFVLWIHDVAPPAWLAEECEKRGLTLIAGGEQLDGSWRGGCAEVLGCLFSAHHEDVVEWLCRKVLGHSDFFEGLTHPELGTQNALTMLKYGGVSRMNYLSRTVAPADFREGAAAFDDCVLSTLESVLQLEFGRNEAGAVDPADPSVRAMRRSIKNAGFGFRSLSFLSPIAFLSAAVMAAPVTYSFLEPQLDYAVEERPVSSQPARASMYAHAIMDSHAAVRARGGESADKLPVVQNVEDFCETYKDGVEKKFQRDLTQAIEKILFEALQVESSPADIARWNSQTGPLASGWKTTHGFSPDTRMRDDDVRRCVRFALGSFQADAVERECSLCGKMAGPDHAMLCASDRCKIRRIPHDHVEAYLAGVYSHELMYPVSRQPKWADSRDMTDLQITNIHNNTTKEIDIATRLATAPTYMNKDAQDAGHSARNAAAAKDRHKVRLEPHGVQFVPFALENHGRCGKEAVKEIKWIARQLEMNFPDLYSYSRTVGSLRESLSVALQVGNAQGFRQFANDARAAYNNSSRRGEATPLQGSFSVPHSATAKDPARSYPHLQYARNLVGVAPDLEGSEERERESESEGGGEREEEGGEDPVFSSFLHFAHSVWRKEQVDEVEQPTMQPLSNEAPSPFIVDSNTSEDGEPLCDLRTRSIAAAALTRAIVDFEYADIEVDINANAFAVLGLFGDLADVLQPNESPGLLVRPIMEDSDAERASYLLHESLCEVLGDQFRRAEMVDPSDAVVWQESLWEAISEDQLPFTPHELTDLTDDEYALFTDTIDDSSLTDATDVTNHLA